MPEAQAMAVRGDRIVALGSSADIRRYVGPATQVVDLQGQLVIPGLHRRARPLHGVGDRRAQLKLMKTTSWDEIVAMVAAAAKTAKPGSGSTGAAGTRRSGRRRPNPNVEGFPTHASLDAVSPDNPVLLTHASGHASFANAKAMELSGITQDHAQPAGRRHPQGRGRRAHGPAARDARPA